MHSFLSADDNIPYESMMIDCQADYILVKNEKSEAVCVSDNFHLWTGYQNPIDYLGLKDSAIKAPLVQVADQFMAQDRRLIEEQKIIIYIVFGMYPHRPLQPYINIKQGYQSYVVCYSRQAKNGSFIKHLYKTAQLTAKMHHRKMNQCFELIDYYANLTIRQSEIYYFLMQHYSSTDIANILRLSKRTIQHAIERIKDILRCNSTQQLVQLGLAMKYHEKIPKRLVVI